MQGEVAVGSGGWAGGAEVSTVWDIRQGCVLDSLRAMPDESVQCVVTSPPYYGLRDYGLPPSTWADGWIGCLGLEPNPDMFVAHCVEVFAEVKRVLRADGTCWVNIGDSYNAQPGQRKQGVLRNDVAGWKQQTNAGCLTIGSRSVAGLKPKDLIGIPWMLAFALRANGWYLRSEIIWAKTNPMPESVTDRPTKAHEQMFLFSKNEKYYYDSEAIKEPCIADHEAGNKTHKGATAYENGDARHRTKQGLVAFAQKRRPSAVKGSFNGKTEAMAVTGQNAFRAVTETRNKRSVWTVSSEPYKEAHFATYPTALIEPCILAGCPVDGVVLDPFSGSGTTGIVALRNGRRYIGCELNPEYIALSRKRLDEDKILSKYRHCASCGLPLTSGPCGCGSTIVRWA